MADPDPDPGGGGGGGGGAANHEPHDHPDTDSGRSEKETHSTASDTRSQRATGGEGGDAAWLGERATGSAEGGKQSLPEQKKDDTDKKSKRDFLDELLEKVPNPGERTMDWLGIDCAPESKPQNPFSEFTCDFAGGVDDFAKNYRDMRTVHKDGADKFFHCNANCESAQRGPGGELAAGLISIGREVIDTPKNVLGRGMSIDASLRDSRDDLHADRVGFEAGRSGLRCYDACRAGFPYKGM